MANKKKPTRRKPKPSPGPQLPDRTDSALKAHFRKLGILFGISQDAVAERLGLLLGRERFEEWQEVNYAKLHGTSVDYEYDLVETTEELTTLFSLQADVSLAVGEWLDQAVASSYLSGRRILDLGCGAGILTAWFASKYPDSEVTGCDAHPGMLKAAISSHSLPNLRFTQWNYQNTPQESLGKAGILVTSFGVDFPTVRSSKESLVIGKMKEGDLCKEIKEFLAPCFRNWRLAANDDAVLHAVLRIPDESTFLGAVDAAQEGGWKFEASTYKAVECGKEYFPAMTFRAADGTGPVAAESRVRAAWLEWQLREQCAIPWRDSVAMCLFESLSGKEILKEQSQTYSDGHTMRATVGRTPFFAFQFTHATTGYARLMLIPLSQADAAEPKFEWHDGLGFDGLWSF